MEAIAHDYYQYLTTTVQQAVEVLFDMNTSDQRNYSRPQAPIEEMTVDDSDQNVWQPV